MTVIIDGTTGVSDVDGTAATPAFRGTDTNTGIFFPAADTIAFSEGGTESMRINNVGYLGIGTTSPGFPLDVQCDAGAFGLRLRGRSDNISVLRFVSNDAATTYGQFDVRSGEFIVNAVANIPMVFNTNNTERMRIDSSGNVGIGTSSPLSTAMLEVSRSTTVIPTATVTADNQVSGWRTRRTGGSFPREYYMGIRENSTALDFYDNTADALRMRITSDGLLQFNSGYGSVANAFGCRAWVNFNGTGTVAIRASGNVSSITDNDTGDYTVNFITAMPDANYSVVGMSMRNSTNASNLSVRGDATYSNGFTTTSVRLNNREDTNALIDALAVCVSIFR